MMEQKSINLRVRADVQSLIDQAADVLGKTRTEFMLEAARAAAIDALLDRTLIQLDEPAWRRFQETLQAPPLPSEKLRRLMEASSPWEPA